MRAPLPLQIGQRQGEPGHGVLVRLACRNGSLDSYRFASFLGLDARRLLTGHDVSVIAGLAGLSTKDIKNWSPIVDPNERLVTLHGVTLADRDWSTRTRRYCPQCLATDLTKRHAGAIEPEFVPYHRAVWDVTAIQACPEHSCILTDSCWRCGQRQGWRSTNLCRCFRCKADLTCSPVKHYVDPVGDYIVARMMGYRPDCPVLDALPLNDALRLCMRLGQAKSLGAALTLTRQSRASALAQRTEGYQIVQNLEVCLSKILDDLVSARRETAPAGLLGTYGWIYSEWLAAEDTTAEIVRPIVYEHAVRNQLMSSDEARLGKAALPTLCVKEVARHWGFGYERTRALLDAAGAIPSGSRAGVAFTISPSIVREISIGSAASISVKAAAHHLKTGAKQIRELLSVGLITVSADGRICKTSLKDFERKLVATMRREKAPDDALPIGHAARVNSVPLHRVCQALLNGDLEAWCGCWNGRSAVIVSSQEVRHLRKSTTDLSVERASRVLGIHPDCVRALHKSGIIPGPGAKVTAEGLDNFKRTFIAGAQWARAAGIRPRAAVHHLAKVGVNPAFAPPKFRQAIYRKSELPSH